jgi:hypothetical protein
MGSALAGNFLIDRAMAKPSSIAVVPVTENCAPANDISPVRYNSGDYRDSVKAVLISVGYLRELAHIVAFEYLPSFAHLVKLRFGHMSWPIVTWESLDLMTPGVLAMDKTHWYSHLKTLYDRGNVDGDSFLALTDALDEILTIGETRPIFIATESLFSTTMRICVAKQDTLALVFDNRTFKRAREYKRFNERLLLLLTDLEEAEIVKNDVVLLRLRNAIREILSTAPFSRKLYQWLGAILIRNEAAIERRDEHFFLRLKLTNTMDETIIEAQIQDIWRSAHPRHQEAIWIAVEDLLDLALDIQNHIQNLA